MPPPPAPRRPTTRLLAPALAAGAAAALVPAGAAAHTGHELGGLAAGWWHPIGGLDHLLAMVAVGAAAVLAHPRLAPWAPPAAFLAGMVLGGAAGLGGLPVAPGEEHAIALSVAALGVVLALAPPPGAWLPAVVALAGALHGHAHGAEAPAAARPALYLLGVLAATAALHLTGVGVGAVLRRSAPALRAAAAGLVGAGAALALGLL